MSPFLKLWTRMDTYFRKIVHEVCERLDVYVVEQIDFQEKQKILA
jgi:hypothetical protein